MNSDGASSAIKWPQLLQVMGAGFQEANGTYVLRFAEGKYVHENGTYKIFQHHALDGGQGIVAVGQSIYNYFADKAVAGACPYGWYMWPCEQSDTAMFARGGLYYAPLPNDKRSKSLDPPPSTGWEARYDWKGRNTYRSMAPAPEIRWVMVPRPWFLASVTDTHYMAASEIVHRYNGLNATGVAGDRLSGEILKNGWKDGMRAKLFMAAREKTQQVGDGIAVAVLIAGGPACNWERWHMSCPEVLPDTHRYDGEHEEHIRSSFPNLVMKVCTNPADMESFLKRGLPLEECE